MAFNWSEYLQLAKQLLGLAGTSSSPEAYTRAAVSRAYYAAFCKARNFLRDKDGGHSKEDLKSHYYVITQFKSDSSKARNDIGLDLRRLQIQRQEADYEDVVLPAFMKNAQLQVVKAQDLVSRLNKL